MPSSVPVYSHSRLSSFEKCPLQYKYRYIEKRRTDTQGIEAFMGNRVHEVLERLYRDLLASRRPSLDELVALYHRNWDAEFSGRVKIVRADRTADDYRGTGEECVENYYRRYEPFDQAATLGLEEKVMVSMDEADRYQLQGYIDRLARGADGAYEIHDYKTSAFVPSDAQLRSDRQLTIYQMAVQKRYPDAAEVRLIWHFLAQDRTLTSSRTADEVARHRRQTIRLIDTIEAARAYPARVSALCRWCEYMDICPEFATTGAVAAPGAKAAPSGNSLVPTPPPAGTAVPSPPGATLPAGGAPSAAGPLQRLAALHERRRAIEAEVAGLRGRQAHVEREIAALEIEILTTLPRPAAASAAAPRRESRRRRAGAGEDGPPRQRELFPG